MLKQGFLDIEYYGGDQSTYKKLEVHIDDDRFPFDTGDFIVDWADCMDWLGDQLYNKKSIVSCAFTSDIGHFTDYDGDAYLRRYLYYIDKENKFFLNDISPYSKDRDFEGKYYFDLYIPKEHPEWGYEELVSYIKKKKNDL